jgi:hypothetical protein
MSLLSIAVHDSFSPPRRRAYDRSRLAMTPTESLAARSLASPVSPLQMALVPRYRYRPEPLAAAESFETSLEKARRGRIAPLAVP